MARATIEDFGPTVEMERGRSGGFEWGRRATDGRQAQRPTPFSYSARAILNDPCFPQLADQLRLMKYRKPTGKNPDVCNEAAALTLCTMNQAGFPDRASMRRAVAIQETGRPFPSPNLANSKAAKPIS